jgi:hypothetical protein
MPAGSQRRFFAALEFFRDLNNACELEAGGMVFAFPEQTVHGFFQEIRKFFSESGLVPVLSHSPIYRHFNDPTYRVVHLKALMSSPLALLAQASHGVKSGNEN